MLINNKRSLAHIERVGVIQDIEGADNIQKACVLGWQLIIKKNEFKEGDLCIYVEIDSKMPEDDQRFDFLAGKHYKIKTMKLGKFNVISQGIAFPLSLFPEIKNPKEGMDVTDILRIKKIITEEEKRLMNEEHYTRKQLSEKRFTQAYMKHRNFFESSFGKWCKKFKFFRWFFGLIWGGKVHNLKSFPDWIVKTDEERIENLPKMLEYTEPLIATEKIDGTSTTFAIRYDSAKHKKYEIFVCSRNVRQIDENQPCRHDENVYWQMFNKYNVETALVEVAKKYNADVVILQGETYGNNLQGNPYKLPDVKFAGYNLIVGYMKGNVEYDHAINDTIDGLYHRVGDTMQRKIDSVKAAGIISEYNIDWVPILDTNFKMINNMEKMKELATAKSVINPKVLREGIVYRSETDHRISFKNVSREFLIKKGE
jgi:hypothetical protein